MLSHLSCVWFCDPMDCSWPGSPVHEISQARIREWVAISFSRHLPNPGIEPASPALAGRFFTPEPPWKPPKSTTKTIFLIKKIKERFCAVLEWKKQLKRNTLRVMFGCNCNSVKNSIKRVWKEMWKKGDISFKRRIFILKNIYFSEYWFLRMSLEWICNNEDFLGDEGRKEGRKGGSKWERREGGRKVKGFASGN